MKKYYDLLRINQWYKNTIVFLALIFSQNLFNSTAIQETITAFIALSLISSASYIFNDSIDKKRDQHDPEKKERPIAAGKVSQKEAVIWMIGLLFMGTMIAKTVNAATLISTLMLFLFTVIYSVFLKKELFADIITIGVNFVIRAITGALAISVYISPWLVLGPFFLALFLATGKRYAEEKKKYSEEITKMLLNISTACLIITYALYCFLSEQRFLLISLPFAIYTIFRYVYFIYKKSPIAKRPEKVFKDQRMLVATSLWLLSTLIAVYYLRSI